MSDPRSAAAWAAFRTRVKELGGEVLEPDWLGSNVGHRIRCAQGHERAPTPGNISRGRGLCITCAGQDSAVAAAAFRARIIELGGQVVGEYRSALKPVKCICAAGHECAPRPNDVQRGQGLCVTCSGRNPSVAEALFRDRIADLGGRVVGKYRNVLTPVDCICPAGHPCRPYPGSIQQGRGMCYACSGRDPAVAELAFRARVAELGGQVIGKYVGTDTPVECGCPAGHPCRPTPGYLRKQKGMCPICAQNDPDTAKRAFYARVSQLGGRVVGPYVNCMTVVECVCSQGHRCSPRPNAVQQGQGLCGACRGAEWDLLYVVTNPSLKRVKFGITSGGGRARLADHRRAGYTNVLRVLPDLDDAHALERHIRATLRDAGTIAVQGREYFHIDALAVVLDVVDGWVPA